MKRLRKFISLLLVLSMLLGLTVTASADGGGNTAEDPGQAGTPAPVSADDQDNNEEIDEDVEDVDENAGPKEACLTINDIDYHCRYDETEKKYTFGVYNWVEGTDDEDAHLEWATQQLPDGVSYDYTRNTLTLSGATLTSLCLSYSGVDEESGERWYNLPNEDLTIELVDENTIGPKEATNEDESPEVLVLCDGVRVTIKGTGSLTVTRNGQPLTGHDNVSLTMESGTVTLAGNRAPENLAALTVKGGTLTMPGGWLNGTYTQTGGTVHVTGVADGDGTYYQGLSFGSAANISGGTLNVNVNVSLAENEDINEYWSDGISFSAGAAISGDAKINVTVNRGVAMVVNNGSTYTQTGGTVTVVNTDNNDPCGFTVDGAGINEWEDEEGKHSESYSASTANISGGKLIVKGKLNVNGTLNLSDIGEITVTAIDGGYNFPPIYDEYGNDTNWQGAVLVMANTTGTANLNINGGTLTAEALHGNAPALCVGTSGVYTQTGGKVDLTNTYDEGRAMDIENIATVNGGVLNATGDANGIWVNAGYSNVSQMRFVVNGGEVNATGGIRGLVAYGYYTEIATGRRNGATVVLNGGKLTATGGTYGAVITSSHWILDEEELEYNPNLGLSADMVGHIISATVSVFRVTGGEHSFIGETTGLSLSGDTEITGGTLHLSGGTTAIFAGQVKTNGVAWNSFTMGSNMHAVSDNTGAELTLVANEATDYYYSDGIDSYYREGNTVYGSYATDVTISPASGVVPTTYAATLDVQTGVITAGAPVTVVYNVSGNGYVSFTLPEGVELVEGSVSDGVTLRGLTDIPVNGAATISFQVVPRQEGNFTVMATFTQTSGGVKEEEIEFSAGGFDISLPTYTSKYLIRANGVGVPGETVTVTLKNKNKDDNRTVSASTTVTELGTFALTLDLSKAMDVTTTERAEFEITVTEDRENYAYDQTVVYEQSIPQVDWVTVTNTVHGVTQSVAVDEVTTIDFSNGYGKPDRSFYTYWPELRTFRFAVQLVSNDGVKGVCVRVYYQDDTTVDVKLELGTDGVWRENANLDRAPVGYQVIIVYELRTDPNDPVTPAPGGDDDDPTVNPNVVIIRTEIVPIIPIMDPSGTVYSQFTGMPVAGATATLYYGGNGTAPGEPTLFDMTSYGQVNPMTTDALGHYAWNVPDGWWKVVVSYGSSSTESEWMHVLPVQTGVDLYLTDGTYVIPTVPSTTPSTKPTDKKDDKKDDETTAPVFSDVSSSQWFYDDVVYMAENGLMTGVGVGSFAPNSSLTRGMVVTMLARMAGVDTSTGSVWYEAGRTWAMQNGVSDGTGMTDDITREQLAAMLYRYAKLMGEDTSAAADLSAFSDADQISGWAVEAMAWAVQRGILQGADGKLMPGGTATRAQAAAMFHRFLTK